MTTDVDKVWGDLDIPADERADLLEDEPGDDTDDDVWGVLLAADRALGHDIGAPEAEEQAFDLFEGVSQDSWEHLSPQARRKLLE